MNVLAGKSLLLTGTQSGVVWILKLFRKNNVLKTKKALPATPRSETNRVFDVQARFGIEAADEALIVRDGRFRDQRICGEIFPEAKLE